MTSRTLRRRLGLVLVMAGALLNTQYLVDWMRYHNT
jgi:hypothetical protein